MTLPTVIGTGINAALKRTRATLRWMLMGLMALTLAGCGGGMDFGELFSDTGQPADRGGLAETPPQTPGAGAPRVALLLPLSAPGKLGQIARAMKKSAELAMVDAGNPGITLVAKDTRGTAAGAQMAAQAAVGEGAKLILGPLLASSVKAVKPVAAGAGVPVIAFSSQSSVAGGGVYLMSFLPEEEVDNVIRYAVKAGKRNLAALIPQSDYGTIVGRALRESAKRHGASIVAEERYVRTATGMMAPASRMARKLGGASKIDALFFPEGPKLMRTAGDIMSRGGVTPGKVQLLGTGLWDTAAIRTTPLAIGGWYAGVEPRLVRYFADHYMKTYGTTPPRIASLAYDATSLAIALGRSPDGVPFSQAQILNPEGYQGMNGLFRFRQDGRIQRGLAILQVTPTGPQVVEQAPARFPGS